MKKAISQLKYLNMYKVAKCLERRQALILNSEGVSANLEVTGLADMLNILNMLKKKALEFIFSVFFKN